VSKIADLRGGWRQWTDASQVYEVKKLGCCDAPNTYTYFSLRDGKKLRTTHTELNRDEFVALEQSLYN
jgi:hypothetical protein